VTTSSRNFSTLDILRSRSTSGPASDLGERVLMRLDEGGPLSERDLIAAVGADAGQLRASIETLVNLKLVKSSRSRLQISDAGKAALKLKLLSVAS
jgi:hypothetical protein